VLTARSLSLLNELAEQIRESYGVKVKVFQADISFKETGDDAR
jgi:short-subunit dehydrogenase